ncbi:ribosome-recycling factor [endosymbiont of Euscepes postfasciatus]|uniref:ribosome recycling factor n=1 Tax=endosymbiont of Euscepes postfasciatus TaxID=650377 RepID=UPI000DC705EE|nr:ribosome recycling factor [endosymbiont of Euscepes postfasciatus]BBA84728.1 ribosome-recycling factor [endosymbiont of Euscepes postfasciatus]
MNNLEKIIQELNSIIYKKINDFKDFVNKIHIDKMSTCLVNNIKIDIDNNKTKKKIYEISNINLLNNNSIEIIPNDKKNLKYIYISLNKNNYLDFNISKNNKSIILTTNFITIEKKKKIINFINKELEFAKINIRNIRRDFNNKIKYLLKTNKLSEDNKNFLLKKIDININNFIYELDLFFLNKKNKFLKT